MRSHLEGRSAGKRLRSDHVTRADHVAFRGDHVVGRKGGSLECIFSGIQLEVDRSVMLCQQVLNSFGELDIYIVHTLYIVHYTLYRHYNILYIYYRYLISRCAIIHY